MKGFEALQSLSTCHDLQMVDGHVQLNGEQLAEINSTIESGSVEHALVATNDETINAQETRINELTEENTTLRRQVEERDAEISELRQQLAESNHDTDETHQAVHNGNHNPSDEADDGLSPMEYAKKHEEMYHKI